MSSKDNRVLAFFFIALVMTGALVGYAAIPQNTLRQNAGIVMPTVNATAGYYVGANQIIDATTAAALATLDTGQGANELYDMDQNVLTTSDVNFTSLEADNLIVRGNINATQLAMYPQQPASYIVWRDGSTYYAKDGTTGAIDFSGADAATVIQNAVNNGGLILIRSGLYTITSPIEITKTTWIKGAGMDWHDEDDGTVLQTSAAMAGENGVFEYDEVARIHFCGISDLTIYNLHAKNAIYATSLSDAIFKNIYINHAGGECGIYILGSMDTWNIWIQDCLIENVDLAGIRIDPASSDITKIHILDNYLYADDIAINFQENADTGGTISWATIRGNIITDMKKVGIMLWKDASHIDISNNLIRNCGTDGANTYHAVRVGDGDAAGDKCQYINIHNNIIDGLSNTKYGVSLEDSSDNILVQGNTIHGCASASINVEATVTNENIEEITDSGVIVNDVVLRDGAVLPEGQVYGVQWNQPTDTWTQIDIDGATITPTTADFNDHTVWGSITRVNLNATTGTINARLGDGDYAADGSNGEVMVEIPAFYVKGEQTTTGVYQWWISGVPMTGFEVHPAFLQRDGRPKAYIYVGAYEASLMVGTGVHDSDTTLKLHTRSAEQPWTGGEIDALPYDTGSTEFTRGETLTGAISGATGEVVDWYVSAGAWATNDAAGKVYLKQQAVANFQAENIAGDVSGVAAATGIQVAEHLDIAEARTYAGNHGEGWGIMNIWSLSAVKLLFIVEYGNMDSQTEIGRGVVDLAAGVGYAGLETAAAGVDGNLDAAGTGVGTGADGDVPATYRYMENLWGNVWYFVDGYNAVDAEYRLIERDGDGTFADALASYEASSMAPIQVNGYIQDIEWDRVMKYLFIASDTTGGSAATYIPDYQYSHDAGETNILLAGDYWYIASLAGLGLLYSAVVASAYGRSFGARAEYIP